MNRADANKANIYRFVDAALHRGIYTVVDESRGEFADQSKKRIRTWRPRSSRRQFQRMATDKRLRAALEDVAHDPEHRQCVQAITVILDRAYGKPEQP